MMRFQLVPWSLLLLVAACSLSTDFDRFKGRGDDGFSDSGSPATAADGGAEHDGGAGDHDAGMTEPGSVRVTLAGSGQGSVRSTPAGIDCGKECSATFAPGDKITLAALPADGSAFVGWGGACAAFAHAPVCTLTAGEPAEVSAEFAPSFDLLVMRGGHGSGVVASEDGVLNCDGTALEVCMVKLPSGSSITLKGVPAANGSTFSGWGGDCTGKAACALKMDGPKMVNAVFDSAGEVSLIVSKIGSGEGKVSSQPAGVDCGIDCSEPFVATAQTSVMLSAEPFAGSSFVAFTGCDQTSGSTCTVKMGAVRNVTAEFSLTKHTLMVAWAGRGAGSVSAMTPSGLSCTKPAACTRQYDHGTMVTLEAKAATGSSFVSWSGGGCGTNPTCKVSLSDDTLVVANFALNSYHVTVGAVGQGTVLCGSAACVNTFEVDYGTQISFGSEPDAGWELASWDGACSAKSPGAPCVLSIVKDTNVIGTFAPHKYQLTVSVEGTGSVMGSIGHDGASQAFACATGTCKADIYYGDSLSLSASAGSNFNFAGWGGDCGGAGTCSNDGVDSDLKISATFSPAGERSLSLDKLGRGDVTSSPAGISCSDDCAGDNASFAAGTKVTLTASEVPGYSFKGWSGCDSTDNATCTVSMNQPVEMVTATFVPGSYPLSVAVAQSGGKGSGQVSAQGITCSENGGDCSETLAFDSSIQLTAAASAGSEFVGWSGDCSGVSATCELTMSKVSGMKATATFRLKSYEVTVTRAGGFDNQSTVAFDPAGAACTPDSGDCHAFDHGTDVTLTAKPAAGSTFEKWLNAAGSGPCHNSTSATCSLSKLASAQDLTAQFGVRSYVLTTKVTGPGSIASGESTPLIHCADGASSDACMASYMHGSMVTLNASLPTGARFGGWGGACAEYGQNLSCSVSMTQARSVSASFISVFKLSVELVGDGVGTLDPLVTGSGINCMKSGGVCNLMLDDGSKISLTASAPKWSTFSGFSDNCKSDTDRASCSIELHADTTVQAIFKPRGALVFVSSDVYLGGFAGMKGATVADVLCAKLASTQQLPGPWVAWLSDANTHPASFKGSTKGRATSITTGTPVVMVDGTMVASAAKQLVDGSLAHGISLDEKGTAQLGDDKTGAAVWTATATTGLTNTADNNYCGNWSVSLKTSKISQGIGNTAATDTGWTVQGKSDEDNKGGGIVIGPIKVGGFPCSSQAHLYCFRDIAVTP